MPKTKLKKTTKNQALRLKLDSAMLRHYQRLEEEQSNRVKNEFNIKNEQNRQQQKMLKGILIIAVISILIAFFISEHYKLPFTFFIVLAGLFFIPMFGTLEYVITKNEERHKFSVQLVIQLLSVIILVGQFSVMVNQNTILNQQTGIGQTQTSILESTSQSNYPEILIASSQGYPELNLDGLTRNNSYGRIGIGVFNTGKATAPSINIVGSDDTFTLFVESGPGEELSFSILNLTTLNYAYTWFGIHYYGNNSSEILGEHNVQFRIDCPFCKKPTDYQNITICIYNISSSLDCPRK